MQDEVKHEKPQHVWVGFAGSHAFSVDTEGRVARHNMENPSCGFGYVEYIRADIVRDLLDTVLTDLRIRANMRAALDDSVDDLQDVPLEISDFLVVRMSNLLKKPLSV